jgi:hypothetical protein
MRDLLDLARKSGMAEVLEAVAAVCLQYAGERPEMEERDFLTIVNDLKDLADKVRNNDEHNSHRAS